MCRILLFSVKDAFSCKAPDLEFIMERLSTLPTRQELALRSRFSGAFAYRPSAPSAVSSRPSLVAVHMLRRQGLAHRLPRRVSRLRRLRSDLGPDHI
jgi:hypothetical protein